MQHPQLSELAWDPSTEWWIATVEIPERHKKMGIAASPDLEKHLTLATNFVNWIWSNYDSFITAAAAAAFNFDLIWDESLDESKLASMITINAVNVYDGVLRVWLDMGGATTDHLIQTKLNEQHEIVEMEK